MDEKDFLEKVRFLGTMHTVRTSIVVWGNVLDQFGLLYPEDAKVTEHDIMNQKDYYREKIQVIEESKELIRRLIEEEIDDDVDESQMELCQLTFDYNTRKGCTEIGVQYGDYYEDDEESKEGKGEKYYLVAHILIDENNKMKCTGIAG